MKTDAVIIDYGAGNLRSARNALQHVCPESGRVTVSADPRALDQASHIILPGVGAFGDCRRGLEAVPGMIEALEKAVFKQGKAFLGVCVGMQLMAEKGLEHGEHRGLGWLPADVVPMKPEVGALKVPHMGWNSLRFLTREKHPVLEGIVEGDHAYFVHSYYLRPRGDAPWLKAVADYGTPLTAIVAKDNLVGTQFHPEKSQKTGLTLLHNFLRWRL